MTHSMSLRMVSGALAVLCASTGHVYEVPESPENAMHLTAQDYVEIRQLVARYPYALDHCTNGGYDYADAYVDDGMFAAATEWGTISNDQRTFVAKGRDELAEAAGGAGDGTCLPPEYNRGYGATHIITNHLIVPTKDGAVGLSRLISVGICNYPHNMELQGGYEDVYVKTDEGWKFKSRIHVMDFDRSIQFGACASD